MADQKVSALTAEASPASTDLLYVVTDPAGTPTSKKATIEAVVAAAAGGSGWLLVDSWTHSGDVSEVDFADLGDYSDLLIVTDGITRSVLGTEAIVVSTDNGSTFYTSSGDYVAVTEETGAVTNTGNVRAFGTFTTAARSGSVRIHGSNVNGGKKAIDAILRSSFRLSLFGASTSPINAVRVFNPEGGNLTGGSIYVFGRP